MFAVYFVKFVSILSQLLMFALAARVILTWLRVVPRGLSFTLFVETTEPILRPIRSAIPPVGGVLDISPIIAGFLIVLIRDLVISIVAV